MQAESGPKQRSINFEALFITTPSGLYVLIKLLALFFHLELCHFGTTRQNVSHSVLLSFHNLHFFIPFLRTFSSCKPLGNYLMFFHVYNTLGKKDGFEQN